MGDPQSVAEKAKFIYELSEEVKQLKAEMAKDRKHQSELEEWIRGDLSTTISQITAELKKMKGEMVELRGEVSDAKDKISALTGWRDEKVGRELEAINSHVAGMLRTHEQRISGEIKEREAGNWAIFAKKQEQGRQDAARDAEMKMMDWERMFGEHKEHVRMSVEAELKEIREATRNLKEGAKTLSKMEAAAKRNEEQLDRVEKELRRMDDVRASAQATLQAIVAEAKARVAPEKEHQQFSYLVSSLDAELKKVQASVSAFEDEKRQLLSRASTDFNETKQEQVRILREEVSRKVGEEFSWHGISGKKSEESKSQQIIKTELDSGTIAVVAWLKQIGLPDYSQKFIEAGFEFLYVVALLDESDLDAMGITVLGHRKMLLSAAKQINQSS